MIVPPIVGLEDRLAEMPLSFRRFAPEDLHVTVAFLGPVGEARARSVFERIGPLRIAPPLTVSLGALRPFGRPRRPSAFAFEFERGRERLDSLIGENADRWRALARRPPEGRAPRAHVTVCRPPRRVDPKVLREALALAARVRAPDALLELRTLALFTAAADRRTRLFERVAERALSE